MVAVSINICPWQDLTQFGIKVPGTPCGTPECRWDVSYVQQSRTVLGKSGPKKKSELNVHLF